MSDGPHRSLPMRPWWRQLAERADKCAFDIEEVADAIVPTLELECFNELTPIFLQRLCKLAAEPGLFGAAESPQFDRLSVQTNSGLARRVLDNVAMLSPVIGAGSNLLQRALENAIQGEAQRYIRQIEEHYRRKSSASRAMRERDRLNEALGCADISAVARKLLEPGSSRSVSRVPRKTGLDEGARLR